MMIFKRKFLEEKFREINLEILEFKEKLNFIEEKLLLFEQLQEDFTTMKEQFSAIYESLTYEPTPEELKEQEELAKKEVENMKLIVRSAISDMLADPKNQQAIQEFASQFTSAMRGDKAAFGFDINAVLDSEGQVDPLRALFMFFANKKGGLAY
ncbi:MAG: hypothetical protein ACTSR2_04975 [Candidatus Hodarchaeales archaeon]